MSGVDEQRDGTAYVQGFLDRGLPVPPGEYWCPDGVTVPADYIARAEAAGRELDAGVGGWPLSGLPAAVMRYRGGWALLSGVVLPGHATAVSLGRDGCAMYIDAAGVAGGFSAFPG
jgi:hypothetical protein